MRKKALFAWSGGKDSALALYEIQKTKKFEVVALLTTVTKEYERIPLHGVRETLLEKQAESLRLPLEKIYVSKDASEREYETQMKEKLMHHKNQEVSFVIFGDIFLESLRKYREKNLSKINMKAVFPLWRKNTAGLARKLTHLNFRAITTCIDGSILDKRALGRDIDAQFLSELPPGVDPCGENGEYHSFVYDGPIFREKISFKKGKVVCKKNRFYYCDLIPPSVS